MQCCIPNVNFIGCLLGLIRALAFCLKGYGRGLETWNYRKQTNISHDMTKPTKWLCAQRRLKSGWASAQSNQSLRCPHEESLGPLLYFKRTAKTDQTGRMPRLIRVFAGRTCHFVGFVMRRLTLRLLIYHSGDFKQTLREYWSTSFLYEVQWC